MSYALYIASTLGALALMLMMPRRGFTPAKIGALLGACTLGGLWLVLARHLPDGWGIAGGGQAFFYYYLFSAIALVSAVRVMTHTKPVYSALWFILVILSTCGTFLLLGAEFMAMAVVIIYGGAILVTYVFVIMLASPQAKSSTEESPDYDRLAWEPLTAVAAGFLLLAVILSVVFEPMQPAKTTFPPRQTQWQMGQTLLQRADVVVSTQLSMRTSSSDSSADAGGQPAEEYPEQLVNQKEITNTEAIGLDLFQSHPLGLELAGVILLVSLIGAVVISRQPSLAPSLEKA